MIKHTFSNPPFLPFFSLLLFIGNQYNFIFMALQRLFWPLRFFLLLIICICMFTSQIGHNLISYLIKLQRNWNCLQRCLLTIHVEIFSVWMNEIRVYKLTENMESWKVKIGWHHIALEYFWKTITIAWNCQIIVV